MWLQVRARSVRPAFEAALSEGLGSDWRASIRPDFAGTPEPTAPWLRGILLPFQRHAAPWSELRMFRTLPAGGLTSSTSIVGRTGRAGGRGPASVLIHLHGGGFVQGGKSRESVTLLNQLVDHGWFCVSANYGLRSQGAFPQSLVDTKRVIAWVRAHAGE